MAFCPPRREGKPFSRMKTARFKSVVERAGEPKIHLVWSEPTRDPVLKTAAAECRLMTLHQELHGAKKDYGEVGLHPERNAQYLLFPRSLRKFSGRRVVGIDYGRVHDAALTTAKPLKQILTSKRPTRRDPEPKHETKPARPPRVRPEAEISAGHRLLRSDSIHPAHVGHSTRRSADAPPAPESPAMELPQTEKPRTVAEWRSEVTHAVAELKRRKTAAARRRLEQLLRT
jgi:hypothetical protein